MELVEQLDVLRLNREDELEERGCDKLDRDGWRNDGDRRDNNERAGMEGE